MENQKNNAQQEVGFEYIPIKEAAKRSRMCEFLIRRIVDSENGYVKVIRSGKKVYIEYNSLIDSLEKGNLVV